MDLQHLVFGMFVVHTNFLISLKNIRYFQKGNNVKNKLLLLIFVLFAHNIINAQLMSVTATLTDTDGQVWTNGTCTITAYNSTGGPNYYQGIAIPSSPACAINSSGVLSASLYNTGTLNPASAQYQFTIQSNTSAKASTFLSPVTSSNLSSTLYLLLLLLLDFQPLLLHLGILM